MKFMKRLAKVVRRAFGFCGGIIVGLGIATAQLSNSTVEIQAVQKTPCEDQIVVADARFSSDGNQEEFLPPVSKDRFIVVAQNTASSEEEGQGSESPLAEDFFTGRKVNRSSFALYKLQYHEGAERSF